MDKLSDALIRAAREAVRQSGVSCADSAALLARVRAERAVGAGVRAARAARADDSADGFVWADVVPPPPLAQHLWSR